MGLHGCHAALLRPDHYVFGTAADAAALKRLQAARRATLNHNDPETDDHV
jgi:hypothetical protein